MQRYKIVSITIFTVATLDLPFDRDPFSIPIHLWEEICSVFLFFLKICIEAHTGVHLAES